MDKISDIQKAEEKVLSDMNKFIENIRRNTIDDIPSLGEGLARLRNIRASVYENLNQIQHEYLILQGLSWLSINGFGQSELHWYWNPRQTGNSSEPDLKAVTNGKIVVSAEATTSEKPQGIIDSRMRDTLSKLNQMEGNKYYFVRTKEMEQRAKTKVTKNKWDVKVVIIEE
jgi:hypothetical protein